MKKIILVLTMLVLMSSFTSFATETEPVIEVENDIITDLIMEKYQNVDKYTVSIKKETGVLISTFNGVSKVKVNEEIRYFDEESLVYNKDNFIDDTDEMFTKENVENYLNLNKITSKTDYLLYTDLSKFQTAILKKDSEGKWEMIDTYIVGIGAPETPTVVGTYEVYAKSPKWNYNWGYVENAVKYHRGYAFHSILLRYDGTVYDGRTGVKVSHGCYRQTVDKAEWIYKNIPIGTKVINER